MFTYDLTTNVGKVRLLVGDTVQDSGVRPDGSNFTDDEIDYFLDAEGDSIDMATARACDVLATQWANVADLSVGPRRESLSQVAERYAERAKQLRSGSLSAGYITLDFVEVDS